MSIILASQSPRRRELLEMLGLQFEIRPAVGDEIIADGLTPAVAVKALSGGKAEEVAALCDSDTLVIAADTVVAHEGKILGKPRDEEDAFRMLSALSGAEHRVYTGVTLIRGETQLREAEETIVRFRPMTEREIRAYIRTGEPMDKAGAYGAQGIGALFVDRIEGDFFNVMGLPLCRLCTMLKKMDVELL